MRILATMMLLAGSGSGLMAQWVQNTAINTPVCTAAGKQVDVRMEGDGKGGTILTWVDFRSGTADIYAQRLNREGVPMWTANGVAICTQTAEQGNAAIVSDGNGGAIIAWSDLRSGLDWDIYAQRIDSNGVALWAANGVPVATKTEREDNERIISDGAGGAIIVWEQERTSNQTWDIWAQRINLDGQVQWPQGGLPVVVENANRINPRVQSDKLGGAFIVWQDARGGVDFDIYAQHMDGSGVRLWSDLGRPVAAIVGAQTNPKIDPDDQTGGVYIAWTDTRLLNPGTDIYAARLDADGNALWVANGVPVSTALNSQSAIDIASDTLISGLIVTWKDNRSGNYDIYAQKITELGDPSWTPGGIPICSASGDQLNPNIVPDMVGGAIIVWQDSSGSDWSVRSQRVSGTGNVQWAFDGEWVGTASGDQTSPKNVSDDLGGSIYAWQDKRSGTNDIYAHHLNAAGEYTVVGIPEAAAELAVIAWPNPSHADVWLELGGHPGEKKSVELMDMAGKVVWKVETVEGATMVPAAAFPGAGVYVASVNGRAKRWFVRVVRI